MRGWGRHEAWPEIGFLQIEGRFRSTVVVFGLLVVRPRAAGIPSLFEGDACSGGGQRFAGELVETGADGCREILGRFGHIVALMQGRVIE